MNTNDKLTTLILDNNFLSLIKDESYYPCRYQFTFRQWNGIAWVETKFLAQEDLELAIHNAYQKVIKRSYKP